MIAQLLGPRCGSGFCRSGGRRPDGAGVWSFTQLSTRRIRTSRTIRSSSSRSIWHAAEEIEQQVSVPIERALNSVPNVIARRSRTIFGLSVVELTFEYGTNDYFARQVVLEKLRDATLPDGVTPTLGPMSTPIGEVYKYTLEGAGYDSRQLREIEDWIIEPRLLQVPGVTDITPFGGVIKQCGSTSIRWR
jgi:cobalt-zinc-cadmium resistance protein CzcA